MSDIKKMYQTDIIQAGEEIGFSRKKTVPLCAGTDCNSVMCVCVGGDYYTDVYIDPSPQAAMKQTNKNPQGDLKYLMFVILEMLY